MRYSAFVLVALASFWAGPALSAEEAIPGVYRLTDGKVTIKVTNCGQNICANIVGLKEPISKIDGKPKVDRENPDTSKRKRPLMGLSVLIGMKPTGDKKWKGSLYNPDDGKTYSASVSLNGDTFSVKACIVGILCKTNKFVRLN
ncbi:MAG: DUF2147 domain-containing protein [Aestuariivirga sp.]